MTTALPPLKKISQLPTMTTVTTSSKIWFAVVDENIGRTRKFRLSDLQSYLQEISLRDTNNFTLKLADGDCGLQFTSGASTTDRKSAVIELGSYNVTISDNKTYKLANTANTTANTALFTAKESFKKANIAFELANTANIIATAANTTANTALFTAKESFKKANIAFELANTANIIATAANTTATIANNKINTHTAYSPTGTGKGFEHHLVSNLAHGFMSIQDKTNLDEIVNNGRGGIIIQTEDGLVGGSTIASNNFTLSANSASTNQKGIVKLVDSITSTSVNDAATANSISWLNKLIPGIIANNHFQPTYHKSTFHVDVNDYYLECGMKHLENAKTSVMLNANVYVTYASASVSSSPGLIKPLYLENIDIDNDPVDTFYIVKSEQDINTDVICSWMIVGKKTTDAIPVVPKEKFLHFQTENGNVDSTRFTIAELTFPEDLINNWVDIFIQARGANGEDGLVAGTAADGGSSGNYVHIRLLVKQTTGYKLDRSANSKILLNDNIIIEVYRGVNKTPNLPSDGLGYKIYDDYTSDVSIIKYISGISGNNATGAGNTAKGGTGGRPPFLNSSDAHLNVYKNYYTYYEKYYDSLGEGGTDADKATTNILGGGGGGGSDAESNKTGSFGGKGFFQIVYQSTNAISKITHY